MMWMPKLDAREIRANVISWRCKGDREDSIISLWLRERWSHSCKGLCTVLFQITTYSCEIDFCISQTSFLKRKAFILELYVLPFEVQRLYLLFRRGPIL